MKHFSNYQQFAFITIKENLKIARYCLDTPKTKGSNSCYGMSSLILLASSIDIIGTFYRSGSFSPIKSDKDVQADNQLGSVQSHFEQFYDKFIVNQCERDLFLDSFYRLARCRATHNGVLGPNIIISINSSSNKRVLQKKKRLTHIFLNELYDVVKTSFSTLIYDSKERPSTEIISTSTGKTF